MPRLNLEPFEAHLASLKTPEEFLQYRDALIHQFARGQDSHHLMSDSIWHRRVPASVKRTFHRFLAVSHVWQAVEHKRVENHDAAGTSFFSAAKNYGKAGTSFLEAHLDAWSNFCYHLERSRARTGTDNFTHLNRLADAIHSVSRLSFEGGRAGELLHRFSSLHSICTARLFQEVRPNFHFLRVRLPLYRLAGHVRLEERAWHDILAYVAGSPAYLSGYWCPDLKTELRKSKLPREVKARLSRRLVFLAKRAAVHPSKKGV